MKLFDHVKKLLDVSKFFKSKPSTKEALELLKDYEGIITITSNLAAKDAKSFNKLVANTILEYSRFAKAIHRSGSARIISKEETVKYQDNLIKHVLGSKPTNKKIEFTGTDMISLHKIIGHIQLTLFYIPDLIEEFEERVEKDPDNKELARDVRAIISMFRTVVSIYTVALTAMKKGFTAVGIELPTNVFRIGNASEVEELAGKSFTENLQEGFLSDMVSDLRDTFRDLKARDLAKRALNIDKEIREFEITTEVNVRNGSDYIRRVKDILKEDTSVKNFVMSYKFGEDHPYNPKYVDYFYDKTNYMKGLLTDAGTPHIIVLRRSNVVDMLRMVPKIDGAIKELVEIVDVLEDFKADMNDGNYTNEDKQFVFFVQKYSRVKISCLRLIMRDVSALIKKYLGGDE